MRPLQGRGFLTGSAKPAAEYDEDDMRRTDPRWQPGNFDKNLDAVNRLTEIARYKGISVSQLALAWLLAQGDDIVPIPGSRRQERVAENAGAADIALTAADLAAIEQILPHGGFGERYANGATPVWI
ncbi:aldo/keto reductase [Shewanella morhuae]|uniref:aldo/keto reductase n=1 Tax=Shewanella morhuae TaxID=365591 RepID=UPI0024493F87|nr:aldo/keto reductase [Shewanella morhuae]